MFFYIIDRFIIENERNRLLIEIVIEAGCSVMVSSIVFPLVFIYFISGCLSYLFVLI